jgi:membrane-associated phospholipid phosphatase
VVDGQQATSPSCGRATARRVRRVPVPWTVETIDGGDDVSEAERTSGARTTRVLRLGRSPFDPPVLARLLGSAALLFTVTLLLGVPLAGEPPAFDQRVVEVTTAPEGTTAATLASLIGRVGHLVLVSALAVVIAVIARRRSGRWDVGLLLLTVLGGATVLTGVLKALTDRARPDGAIASTLSAAFPSGHSVRAAAVFGLVALVVRFWVTRPLVRALVLPAAVVLVVVNGAARVVLGVHWPTDVAVGVALGTSWLLVCWHLLRPHAAPRTAALG